MEFGIAVVAPLLISSSEQALFVHHHQLRSSPAMTGASTARGAISNPAPASAAPCEAALSATASALFAANAYPNRAASSLALATSPHLRSLNRTSARRCASLASSVATRFGASASAFAYDSDSDSDGADAPPPEAVFDAVVEAVDVALDGANAALDAAAGIRDAAVPDGMLVLEKKKREAPGRRRCEALDIPKPALGTVDNSDGLFVPLPVFGAEAGHRAALDEHLRGLAASNVALAKGRHPCESEIGAAAARMAAEAFAPDKPTLFRPLVPEVLGVIEGDEELFEAAQCMLAADAIAVDIEHHSVRSFQGFICLMQISTRDDDFIIDAIKLRGSIRRALAPVFADDRIVKVMHGADHDVKWLERDFGIYVINLFDTGRAAKLLKYSKLSLAYLLSRFADVDVSKKRAYQIADWRQRPLPAGMVDYARSDTHYLLYIWDRLVSELKGKSLLGQAWEESAKVARLRYVKERYDPTASIQLASKFGLCYDARQMRVLAEVCRWRDNTARQEDESVWYVMPNRVMFAIVRGRHAARTADSLLSKALKCVPIPPLVKANAEKLAELICDALDANIPASAIVARAQQKGLKDSPALVELKAGETAASEEVDKADVAAAAPLPALSGSGVASKKNEAVMNGQPMLARSCPVAPLPVRSRVKSAPRSALIESSSDDDSGEDDEVMNASLGSGPSADRGGIITAAAPDDFEKSSIFDLDSSDDSDDERPRAGAEAIATASSASKPSSGSGTSHPVTAGQAPPARSSSVALCAKAAPHSAMMVSSSDDDVSDAGALDVDEAAGSDANHGGKAWLPVGTSSSVYDLDRSDGSDEENLSAKRGNKAGPAFAGLESSDSEGDVSKPDFQMVLESFKAEAMRVPEEFKTVTDEDLAKKAEQPNLASVFGELEGGSVEQEENYVSLRDQHPEATSRRKAKRKRKSGSRTRRVAAPDEVEKPASEPYDYNAERQTRKKGSYSGATDEAVYDPYARFLHKTSKNVRRVKRVRKNPKSGERSLSFR